MSDFNFVDAPSAAEALSRVPTNEMATTLARMDPAHAARTFEYFSLATQLALLGVMGKEEAARILNQMAPDDRTALFRELPPSVTERLVPLLTENERAIALSLLKYPEECVGSVMTPDYVAVKEDWTVKHVLDHIRLHGKDSETLSYIYVTDADDKLIDDIRIREFLLAPLHAETRAIMDRNYITLKTSDAKRASVEIFRKHDRNALPVVDGGGRLVGIVTIDDVIDIAESEATRDFQKLGGAEALDLPYNETPLLTMVKKRATWLVVLFVGEMLTATAMGYFEAEIAKAVVLALFVPLIISSGGNSGSQAATLLVRALALGEVSLREWWRVMKRELVSGFMLGVILGTIGFARIALWSLFSPIYGPHWMLVATTVGISLVGIVTWGALAGSMLPFVLKRLGLDPATSSAPFVATLVDVTGLVIYFSVAFFVLRGTML